MSKTYEVIIHSEYCKGCGLCANVCPLGKLALAEEPDKRGVTPVVAAPEIDCSGCQQCVIICPDAAIEMRSVEEVVIVGGGGAAEGNDAPSEEGSPE